MVVISLVFPLSLSWLIFALFFAPFVPFVPLGHSPPRALHVAMLQLDDLQRLSLDPLLSPHVDLIDETLH